ncbi:NAD(P)-dependent dehydrogenase (short-subunit alcohol dehydrogenase family) [Nocardia tenerifensis]|uniref:NAD(P)-dependent dehydrogenase (Short-subunit alcohol dehydrogenase family) n=1 Tax=Nocardia tenerifensis TaxID=228006 RepID=A0A318JUC5_9NOCA|nr:SDR family oxidoreductase [Nocardia tenerifensis]PXX56549.1 NAD(P)-dependent dehydrogenase (short-subunit alcohol dehydrogenase family) [Nocardia tenerifensis]
MTHTMKGKKLVIVGGGSGIGRRIAADAIHAGATVVLAGRDPRASLVADLGDRASTAAVDLTNEESIARLAHEVSEIDYLVSVAAAHANGPVADLEKPAVIGAFEAKVIGPIMLAKHFGPRLREGGAVLLFSGVAAWQPAPGRAVMATTNGAVSFLAEALAVELAPIRVNALSPGIVDSGAWDGLGENENGFFAGVAATYPARRVGTPADISAAALLALTNPFMTGTTLHVDGGGRLA